MPTDESADLSIFDLEEKREKIEKIANSDLPVSEDAERLLEIIEERKERQ